MTKAQQSFGRDIQALFDSGTIGELTDQQLLERFQIRDGEMAELAFAVLVERHGSMVLHACHAILRDRHLAEDAFQATFLVLARKAGSVWARDSLGPWLYGVASRIARCARSSAARRELYERKAAARTKLTAEDRTWVDRHDEIYEELNRLPHRFRLAVMMCDLEGLTQEEAARRLGWRPGTVRSRLSRARARLRDRLTRRGLGPAMVSGSAWLVRPDVPASLATATVRCALRVASARLVPEALAASVTIAEGAVPMCYVSKLNLAMAVVLTGGLIVGGTALLGKHAAGLPQAASEKPTPRSSNEAREQTQAETELPRGVDGLSADGKARLAVGRKLRDAMFKEWRNGKVDASKYFTAQKQFDDFIESVVLMSDAGRVHQNELRVQGLRRMEQMAKELHSTGEIPETDVFMIEGLRRDAETTLAKENAKTRVARDGVKARLEVAKKVRDALYARYRAGEIAPADNYLTWHKRCDELAYELLLMDGGNRVSFLRRRLADLRLIEQEMQNSFDSGQVPRSDLNVVRYYLLEAEQSLELEKAEGERVQGQ